MVQMASGIALGENRKVIIQPDVGVDKEWARHTWAGSKI